MRQTEDRTSGLKDKTEDQDQISKEQENLTAPQKYEKKHMGNVGHHDNAKPSNHRNR